MLKLMSILLADLLTYFIGFNFFFRCILAHERIQKRIHYIIHFDNSSIFPFQRKNCIFETKLSRSEILLRLSLQIFRIQNNVKWRYQFWRFACVRYLYFFNKSMNHCQRLTKAIENGQSCCSFDCFCFQPNIYCTRFSLSFMFFFSFWSFNSFHLHFYTHNPCDFVCASYSDIFVLYVYILNSLNTHT